MQLDALMGKDISVIPHFSFSQSAPEPFSNNKPFFPSLSQKELQLKAKANNVIDCIVVSCNSLITVSLSCLKNINIHCHIRTHDSVVFRASIPGR